MDASAAMQEYLAEAYRLAYYQDNNPYVSTSSLAKVLDVSAPAVTRMVQRLKDGGFLEHEPYRGIKLTSSGQHEALLTIRRHRLVECFLVDVMNFGWHEVHDSADELGGVVSDELVNRMEKMAGNPRRCPHGEPIPSQDGRMPRVIDYPLNDMKTGKSYIVSRVHTHDDEMLVYFGRLGLKPGCEFTLVDRAPFNGPVQIMLGDAVYHIGYELGGVLRVCSREEFELV